MDQVSRPMLVVLLATVAFAGVWFTALRPGAGGKDTGAQVAAPAQEATKAVEGAKEVNQANADAADGTGASAPAAKPASQATPAQPAAKAATPAQPAAKAATPAQPAARAARPKDAAAAGRSPAGTLRDAPVLRDLERGRAVVLLFWNSEGADDQAARRAARSVAGRPDVAVHVVPISRVGAYERITREVTVDQSPTTMIIAPKARTVQSIVGLTDPAEIKQAVRDALAAT